MIQAVIIEDEFPARYRLKKIINELSFDIEIIAELESVEQSILWFKNNSAPEIVFLDIHLADGNSFHIFESVNINSFIIFTTAYDEYALQAFELNSLDYLLKPIKKEKLANSIEKYMKIRTPVSQQQIAKLVSNFSETKKKERFAIHIGTKIISVKTQEIAYFFSKEKCTFLCTFENKCYPIDYSLDAVEELIDKSIFFRINRQNLIHIDCISKISKTSKSRLQLHIHPPLDQDDLVWVSTHKTSDFKAWLDK